MDIDRKPITISVVTPSFNQAGFLAETIKSVIGQRGDFSIDYLVIDGGSDDGSVEIIRHHENLVNSHHPDIGCRAIRYRWLSEKDRGQTDALMKGFRLAEGEVLAYLNSDDTYLPGTLETVAAFFRDNPHAALLYGDAHYCDAAGEIIGRYPTEDFDFRKLAWFNFFCQPAVFFRNEAFEAVGGLDATLRYAMDYDLFVRIGKRFSCRYLPRYFANYRLHEASKTMRDDALFENYEEAVRLSLRHFGWAPLNRLYGSCYYHWLSRLPRPLHRLRIPIIGIAAICAVVRSLWLNRGLRREDLRMLNMANFRKIFRKRLEVLRG